MPQTNLTDAANVAFKAKKIADVGLMAGYGIIGLAVFGGAESPVAGAAAALFMLCTPLASAVLGGASSYLTARRAQAMKAENPGDSEAVKAFRDAAKGIYAKQALSAGLMVASAGTLGYLLVDSLAKLISLQEAPVNTLGPLVIAAGLAGSYFGLRANAANARLNASEAALTNQPKAQP